MLHMFWGTPIKAPESSHNGKVRTEELIILSIIFSGNTTEVVKELNGNAVASPLGRYVVYFDRDKGNWYSYNVATKLQLS